MGTLPGWLIGSLMKAARHKGELLRVAVFRSGRYRPVGGWAAHRRQKAARKRR